MTPNNRKISDISTSGPPSKLPKARMQPMSDIRRPGPSVSQPVSQAANRPIINPNSVNSTQSVPSAPSPSDLLFAVPLNDVPSSPATPKPKKRSKLKIIVIIFLTLFVLAGVAAGAAFAWYQQQLSPVMADSSVRVRVVIESGSTPNTIARQLKSQEVIRSETAFLIYTQLTKTRDGLKAGTYNLRPSESLPQIVQHLVAGKQDEFSITFLPGDTLANHRKRLIEAGYGAAEVDAALAKRYDHPALATKPASADLEGYIYGETYRFLTTATVEDVLRRSFDELDKQIKKYDLINAYKKQDLTLYQGITLASIVQKEVSGPADSAQVAQVFLRRLAIGMPLGADATFVYAAKKAGQTPSVDFPSPYNTRIAKGLPPGPISSPGEQALLAVARPAGGDYLYFVSGDDGKTYFSSTLEEHQVLTRQYCQKNCALF